MIRAHTAIDEVRYDFRGLALIRVKELNGIKRAIDGWKDKRRRDNKWEAGAWKV